MAEREEVAARRQEGGRSETEVEGHCHRQHRRHHGGDAVHAPGVGHALGVQPAEAPEPERHRHPETHAERREQCQGHKHARGEG